MSKLPTDEIFYTEELNEKRINAYKKLAENYRVQEDTVRDIFSQRIAFACTHTQAHTEGLRKRLGAENKRLRESLERIITESEDNEQVDWMYVAENMVDIAKEALKQ